METTDINKKNSQSQSGDESKSKGSKIGKGLGAAAAMSAATAAGGLAGITVANTDEPLEEPVADKADTTSTDEVSDQDPIAEETITAAAETETASEPELTDEAQPITAETEATIITAEEWADINDLHTDLMDGNDLASLNVVVIPGEDIDPEELAGADIIDINETGFIIGEGDTASATDDFGEIYVEPVEDMSVTPGDDIAANDLDLSSDSEIDLQSDIIV